jgi:hypothetical protein
MSRTFHHGERRIRVRAIRNSPPDLRRLARALIELAQAQAEAEAEAAAKQQRRSKHLRSADRSIEASNGSIELQEEKSA